MSALGERFRAAREARGLSLSDVAEQIRIRSVYLAAIEDENWSTIGAPVYVRGFLRTYARFLGLDTDEIVAAFNTETGSPAASGSPGATAAEPVHYLESSRHRNLSPLLWVASLIAVVLVAFVFYNELTLRQAPSPSSSNTVAAASATAEASVVAAESAAPAASSAAPSGKPAASLSPSASPSPDASPSPGVSPSPGTSPSPGASGSPAADGPQSIALSFTSSSWVRVTVDGSVSMEGTFPAGTARQFHGKTAVLRIGNAGGVQVTVDGKTLGALGKTGDVVERTFTL